MLGISEDQIIEHQEGDEFWPDEVDENAVVLFRNDTDPYLIVDGIDRISVVDQGEAYHLTYWGYMSGHMIVTRDGIDEMVVELLAPQEIPRWLIALDTIDENDPPEWLPENVDFNPRAVCQECGDKVYAGKIITPLQDEGVDKRFCPNCWDDLGQDFLESQ